MNKIWILLLTCIGSAQGNAQSIDSTWFCITGITFDTIGPNTMHVSIAMDGTGTDFVNYPYITEFIEDATGDTIATGAMYYFGQMGGTTMAYPMATLLDTLPVGFTTGTAWFTYDTVICTLPYPCGSLSIFPKAIVPKITVHPNPSDGKFTLTLPNFRPGTKVVVWSTLGELVYFEELTTPVAEVDVERVAAGLYILEISANEKSQFIKILIND